MKKRLQRLWTFVRVTEVWILLAPYTLYFVGASLNQLVLIANHDKFPVMYNARQVQERREAGALRQGQGDLTDEIHCIMSKKTRLNFLGDVFDFQTEYDSPGDLMVQAAEYVKPFMIVVWAVLTMRKLWHWYQVCSKTSRW